MIDNFGVVTVTGGTGSFGRAMINKLLSETDSYIRVLSRSEQNQFSMMRDIPPSDRVTYILADIRDESRLIDAFRGCDAIFHAAANKIAPMSYVHTSEFVKTNIIGTRNVIRASIINGVKKVLFISTDKCCEAYNPYGKSKAMAEEMITEANMLVPHSTAFASVRGGNVWGSRGSVMEIWARPETSSLYVHGDNTTRFHLPMPYWIEFCQRAMSEMRGGEVFIPDCRAWRLADLAHAFNQNFHKPIRWFPARTGDKTHETLISEYEAFHSARLSWGSVIQPALEIREVWHYEKHEGIPRLGPLVSNGVQMLTIDELRTAIVRGG